MSASHPQAYSSRTRIKRRLLLTSVSFSMLSAFGEGARRAVSHGVAATAAVGALIAPIAAQAHTDSLGYILTENTANTGNYDLQVVYGSWHPGAIDAEGEVALYKDGDLIGTEAFSILLADVSDGTLPAGLTPGENYFYADGNDLSVNPSAGFQGIFNFQSATFLNLEAGTYTFGYANSEGLSQNWEPSGNAINSGTFIIKADGSISVPGVTSDIDTSEGSYGSSQLGDDLNPAFKGGTLAIDEDGQTYSNDFTLDGSGTNTVDATGNSTTLSGSFSDETPGTPGTITIKDSEGGGSVTLTGNNTHTGGTTLESGTLALDGSGTLGDASGTTTVNGGTLNLGGTSQTQVTLGQNGGTVQNGNVAVEQYTLDGGTVAANATINASDSFDLNTGTVNGMLTGTGALEKSGTGTVTLTGNNDYTGGTTINGGVLALSDAGTLGATTNDTTINNGTLNLGGTSQEQASLNQNGGVVADGTITVDDYALTGGTVNESATIVANNGFDLQRGTVDGTLSGAGAVEKNGADTVTLTGNNDYTGGTTVNKGTLALSGNGTLGAVSNNTTVNGGRLDFGGTDQVQAGLTQTGGALADGTITVGDYSMSGGVVNADATVIASNGFDLTEGTVNGTLSGEGALEKSGAGTVTLTGNNDYTGGTTVNEGTLALAGNGTLGAVSNSTTVNGGTLDFGGTDQVQVSLTQTGGALADGTITVGDYSMSGGVVNADATVIASNGFDLAEGTVNGTLSGEGAVEKTGTGTVTLTGNNDYTGGTTVNEGTLALAGNGTLGAITNNTTVNGGRLDFGGTDQVQAGLTQTGGALADGTITVGDYSMSGGVVNADATVIASNGFDLTEGTVNGTLSGEGALEKSGAGTVTLTGNNDYTGGTTVNEGTLALAGNGTLGAVSNSTTVNGGTLDFGGTDQVQVSLTQTGGALADGTITVGDYSMSGGVVNADATVIASNGFDLAEGTVNGTLSGEGAVEKTGTGTVTLTGNNDYTGGTTVNEGTLALAGNGTLGAVTNSTTVNGGTLDFGGTDQVQVSLIQTGGALADGTITVDDYSISGGVVNADATVIARNGFDLTEGAVNGTLSGEGALEKWDSGTVTLTGNNDYTGGTTINGGVLALSGAGTLGATTNDTTINNGTLNLGGTSQEQASLNQNGGVVADGTIAVDDYALTGGTVNESATIVANNGFDLQRGTVDGTLSGAGAVEKNGADTVTLTGNNDYTGGTTVNKGTLALSGNGTLGAVTNTTTVNGGTLDFGGTDQVQAGLTQTGGALADGTITVGDYSLSGGVVNADATVIASNGFDLTEGAVNGTLSGEGGLEKSGAGTVTLTGNNDYTGGTTVNEGTLALAGNGTLGAVTADTAVNGGMLDLGGTDQVQASLTQTGGALADGTITVGDYSMSGGVVNANATVIASDTIDLSSGLVAGTLTGTASLEKTGPGTVVLTGDNNYTGGTTIADGTLQIGNGGVTGSITGNVLNNGTLIVDRAGALELDGAISGDGMLVKRGEGTTTLSGPNSYQGGTFIQEGTLALSGEGTLGASTGDTIIIGGSLDLGGTSQRQQLLVQAGGAIDNGRIDVGTYQLLNGQVGVDAIISADDAFDVRNGFVAGKLTGAGGLEKNGSGTVILTGASDYSGGTTVNDGALVLADGGSIEGDVTTNAAFVFAQSNERNFEGAISGSGYVIQAGTGSTRLADGNSYEGGTLISAGTLIGSATSFGSGPVLNNAALVIDQSENADFNNVLSGTGSVTKTGNGILNLVVDSELSGPVSLDQGGIAVNAAFANSTFTANEGTTLSGEGLVGGLIVRDGASLATGNDGIGTLAVAGNVFQESGSQWEVDLGASGIADAVIATGTAEIEEGAVLTLANRSGQRYALDGSYTLLTAANGVTGEYTLAGDTRVSAFFDLVGNYDDPNAVVVEVTQTRQFNELDSLSFNQFGAATGAQSLGLGNGLFDAIAYLDSEAEARNAFDQLSGDLHSSLKAAAIEDSRFIREAATLRLRSSTGGISGQGQTGAAGADQPVREAGLSLWGHGFGSWGNIDGTRSNSAARINRSLGGGFIGLDGAVGDDWRVGAVGGYSRTKVNSRNHSSEATADNYHAGIYGGGQLGLVGIRLGAAYSWHKLDTSRGVEFAGFADRLEADYKAQTAQLFGELGYRIDVNGGAFEPFANLAYVHLHTKGFTEEGGAAALRARSNNVNVTFSTLGTRLIKTLSRDSATSLYGSLGWRHAFGDRTPLTAFSFAAGSDAFVTGGVPIARDAAALEAGIDRNVAKGLTIGVAYSGQISRNLNDHGFKASIGWKF